MLPCIAFRKGHILTRLLVHLSLKPGASQSERLHDLWPNNTPEEAQILLEAAVSRINAIASTETGKPGNAIHDGEPSFEADAPAIRVRVLGTPCVEA